MNEKLKRKTLQLKERIKMGKTEKSLTIRMPAKFGCLFENVGSKLYCATISEQAQMSLFFSMLYTDQPFLKDGRTRLDIIKEAWVADGNAIFDLQEKFFAEWKKFVKTGRCPTFDKCSGGKK